MTDQTDELPVKMILMIEESYQDFLQGEKLADTKLNRAGFYKVFAEVLVEDPVDDNDVQRILLEHLGRMSAMFLEAAYKELFKNVVTTINKPIYSLRSNRSLLSQLKAYGLKLGLWFLS